MKKILIVYDRSGQYNVPFINELNKLKEFKVSALFLDKDSTKKIHYDPLYKRSVMWNHPKQNFQSLYSNYSFPANSLLRIFNGLDHLKNISFITSFDFVIIHGYDRFFKWILFLLFKTTRKKIFIRGETHSFSESNNKVLRLIKYLIIKSLCFLVDGAFPIGTISKNFYKKYNWNIKKILPIVPYTVPDMATIYTPKLNIQKYRKENSFYEKDKKIKFLYLGRLDKRKGFQLLLDAFKKLETKNIELDIVGDGPLKKEIEIKNLKNIIFHGFVENSKIYNYYLKSDFLICPSYYEPWGLVVNEAYNFGLPVLASNKVASMIDLNGKESDLIFESGNLDDLIYKIELLLKKNPNWYNKVVKRNLENISLWNNNNSAKILNNYLLDL